MTLAYLSQQIKQKKSYLCIGLDTTLSKVPKYLQKSPDPIFEFNKSIIDATKDLCVAYKINTAFYEALGSKGWEIMERTVAYIPSTHFKIADAKRGDIGNTSAQYATAFFEVMDFDAITLSPYMGMDSIQPFLEYPGKWAILLALTSNYGSGDFQQLKVQDQYLYETVINKASKWGNKDNLMFVVGATKTADIARIRKLVPEHVLLVPGVGFQGGSLAEVSNAGLVNDAGLLVNVSRAIIYAGSNDKFAAEARIIAQQYQQEMASYIKN